ncbi:hypothetical protein CGC21_17490 [Leishmania donovani]|uniref:Uncharacterized protein n=1 Tax=Leishmania donovani TaxID=5661 RepID=A0A3Q8IBF4_LEIDO|nr:hypothetical protein LdCL_230009500 [Leishmania donovani]TPP50315.1 hypothetical protein CGC21_17490 [Leishmania donovani]
MEARAAARSQRDMRVTQNLSLRRRCMFLMDHEMWRVCALGDSGDAGPTGASAEQLRLSTLALLRTHSRQLEEVTEAGVEDIKAAVSGMTTALLSAPSRASRHAKASSAPTSTAAVPLSSATRSTARENVCWDRWEEALETLLAFLEEPRGTSSAQSPTSGWSTLKGDGNAGGGFSIASCETDLERAVRTLLCELVRHFYEAGRAYYAAKKDAERAAAHSKRSRDTPADGGNTGRCKMRVTWSVAAPIAPLLYDLYTE